MSKIEQLEKQIAWLCKTIPYERAFVMIHDYDYVTPCEYMIDRKAKKKCPLWKDPNYGTYSFKKKYPDQTFENWLEYVDSGEGYTVCKCEDAAKCWKEAARKATDDNHGTSV